MPCWLAKKLRPFPAHSTNAVTSRDGMQRRSLVAERARVIEVGRATQPAAETFSCHVEASIIGVAVWLRTKKRSLAVSYG